MSPNKLNELYHQNVNLAYSYIHKNDIYLDGYDQEDLYQEALLALWKACLNYDPNRGVKFSTFATSCIKNHFVDLIRKNTKRIKTISLTLPEDFC